MVTILPRLVSQLTGGHPSTFGDLNFILTEMRDDTPGIVRLQAEMIEVGTQSMMVGGGGVDSIVLSYKLV